MSVQLPAPSIPSIPSLTPFPSARQRKPSHTARLPTHVTSPRERMMDLLKEVRHVSRQLQDQAFAASRRRGAPSYLDTLRAMLGERLRHGDARISVVGYASAAELGVAVESRAMPCHDAIGADMDYPLRMLFWAAHRRMQGLRPWTAYTNRAQAK